jgi:hypothetical protein
MYGEGPPPPRRDPTEPASEEEMTAISTGKRQDVRTSERDIAGVFLCRTATVYPGNLTGTDARRWLTGGARG